ncbi:hypothetical protein PR002_g9172 [Phytophthora rubi]|uniref:Uncharacterized protein n=1 Tax=Phytophthora rubi TaxID=129364 RepID=A0A6A3MX05_9STRA|nr:hypothetical protein PR002_g9172 [Phytophthora rubi]
MDHYGNVAAKRKLRTPGSKRCPEARLVVVARGGVRARAWHATAARQQAGFGWCAEVDGGVQAVVKMVAAPKPRKPSCRCRGAAVVKLVSVSEPRKPSCGSKAARPCLW